MDEEHLENMRKYDYTLKRLVLMPLHEYERKSAERIIDECFQRYYRVNEVHDEMQWTWMDTYEGIKSTLIYGNERLDEYQGENLDWWDDRICNLDDIDDYLSEYVNLRGFLNFIKIQSQVNHLRLSQNAETMVYVINKLFVHYVEHRVDTNRDEKNYQINLVKANEQD